MNTPIEPHAPTQPSQRLSCPGCDRSRLQDMVACDQTPCKLMRRRLDLRGKGGPAPLAMGLMLFGLGFALIGALVILPTLLTIPHPLVMIGGLLFVLAFCGVSLFFAGIGALLFMGRQTELMASGSDQAMLSLDIGGFVVGGNHYTDISPVDHAAKNWPLSQPASTALIEARRDNASEVLEGALLNLLATGKAELWRAHTSTYLLGRRFGAPQTGTTLFFRPLDLIVPSGSLEHELWALLRSWQREATAGRGPVGLSVGDLLEDYFKRRSLDQPGRELCSRVRAGAELGVGEARTDYTAWYEHWRQQQPELADQLRQEIESALSKGDAKS